MTTRPEEGMTNEQIAARIVGLFINDCDNELVNAHGMLQVRIQEVLDDRASRIKALEEEVARLQGQLKHAYRCRVCGGSGLVTNHKFPGHDCVGEGWSDDCIYTGPEKKECRSCEGTGTIPEEYRV